MRLQVGELVVPIRVRERAETRSRHTGAELVVVTGEAELTGDEAHRRFYAIAAGEGERRVFSLPEKEAPQREWQVQISQYSISGSRYTYSLKLMQFEALNIQALELQGVTVKPYKYKESFSGDALMVDAWVLLSAAERQPLFDFMNTSRYFKVVRRGISDEAREMRFGRPTWSRQGESFKYHLILVEKAYDEGRTQLRLGSENDNARWTLATYEGITEHLLKVLVAKGAISSGEVDAIRKAAKNEAWERDHAFNEVEDADE